MRQRVTWDQVKKEVYEPEEIKAFDSKLNLICEIIEARRDKGLSQKELEGKSGVQQPVIARLEKGNTRTQLDTLLKILNALGKTLAVVDIKKTKTA